MSVDRTWSLFFLDILWIINFIIIGIKIAFVDMLRTIFHSVLLCVQNCMLTHIRISLKNIRNAKSIWLCYQFSIIVTSLTRQLIFTCVREVYIPTLTWVSLQYDVMRSKEVQTFVNKPEKRAFEVRLKGVNIGSQ